MKTRRSLTTYLAVVILHFSFEHSLLAQYTFASVTSNNPGPVAFSVPPVALNNIGQVAFIATSGVTSLPNGIYRGTAGGPLVNIAAINGSNFSSTGANLSMNDTGTVAFYGKLAGSFNGVFTGNGTTVTTIATQSGDLALYGFYHDVSSSSSPSINNLGSVAFAVQKSAFVNGPPGDEILFRQDGPTRVTVAQQPSNFGQRSPSLNDSNQTAFFWNNLTGSGNPREVWRNSGGTNTLMFSNANNSATVADGYVINNAGHILVKGDFTLGSGLYLGVTPGNPTLLVDASGLYSSFGESSLNNSDRIAFLATLDSGVKGIYTGVNPLTSKIIEVGDALDGSIVTDLLFYREGLNDFDQIAFSTKLADGRGGVYIATIAAVPEPATLALLGAAGLGAGIWLHHRRQTRGKKRRVSKSSE